MRPVVKLPSMKWFRCEKLYTGSLGTDPLRGCSSCTTFNYRIKLVKNETQEKLVAVCFYQLPWNCKTNISEFITGIFEATEFGIEIAENWILSQYFLPNSSEKVKVLEEIKSLPEKEASDVIEQRMLIDSKNLPATLL